MKPQNMSGFPMRLALLLFITLFWASGLGFTAPPGPKAAPKKTATSKSRKAVAKRPSIPAELRDDHVRSGPESSQGVALTFDDGPTPELTPRILQVLKEQNAKATFFLIGVNVDKYPDLARMIHEAGFEIGNHTYRHPHLPRLSRAKIREEIVKTQSAIERATGIRPTLFRAPYGEVNADVLSIAKELGLTTVRWCVDEQDWLAKQTTEKIADQTVKNSSAGAIILLHDTHAKSIAAVPAIVRGLTAKNLKLYTAGEMISLRKVAKKSGPGGESPAGPVAGGEPVLEKNGSSQGVSVSTVSAPFPNGADKSRAPAIKSSATRKRTGTGLSDSPIPRAAVAKPSNQ